MPVKTIRLTTYINELEALYTTARADYEENAARIEYLEKEHRQKLESNELNAVGIARENERYQNKKSEYKQKIIDARKTFEEKAAETRRSVASVFKDNYCLNADDLDLKTVELLKRGLLTDKELFEMANDYKKAGNITMYRYCGSFAKKNDNDPAMKHLALDARRNPQRDDLMIVDEFTDCCLRGLRDDIMLSNGVHNRHDEFFANSYTAAKNVSKSFNSPV